jgi:hypothetical protein
LQFNSVQCEQFCGSSGTRTLFSIELATGRARINTKPHKTSSDTGAPRSQATIFNFYSLLK